MSMKLLLDARAARQTADGITRFSLNATRALERLRGQWKLSVLVHPSGCRHFEPLNVELVPCSVPRFVPGENRRLIPLLRKLSPDVYLNYSMAGPTPENIPTLVTVHDLMVLNVPCYFGNGMIRNAIFRKVFHKAIRRSVQHASAIAVPSAVTAREVRRRFPGAADKAFVTGEGQSLFAPGEGVVTGREAGPLLYVGNARAYKNLPRLLTAYGRVWAMNRGIPQMIMVVRRDRAFRGFKTHLDSNPARKNISVVSDAGDQQLRHLYLSCRGLVMPSVCEGFGLPALEAMAAGAPVMASRATALEELVGDAGLLVNPHSVIDIARGVALLARADAGEIGRMGLAGMTRAAAFTWEKAANAFVSVIEGIA